MVYPALAAERLVGVTAVVGAAAALVLFVGIGRGSGSGVGAGFLLLGVDYAASLVTRSGTAGYGVVLYAGGLVLAAELAYWSLEAPGMPAPEIAFIWLRARRVATTAAGSSAVATLVVAVASASSGRSVAREAVAFGAAIGALVLVARLAGRTAAAADAPVHERASNPP